MNVLDIFLQLNSRLMNSKQLLQNAHSLSTQKANDFQKIHDCHIYCIVRIQILVECSQVSDIHVSSGIVFQIMADMQLLMRKKKRTDLIGGHGLVLLELLSLLQTARSGSP
jgi:hypothetical protein